MWVVDSDVAVAVELAVVIVVAVDVVDAAVCVLLCVV